MFRAVIRQVAWAVAIGAVLAATPAQAQDPRIEIGGSVGWTLSDGVTFDGVVAGNGNVYNSIEPKDSFSYSLNLGFLVNPNVEVGFLFDQQKSKLVVGGTSEFEVGDMSVDNYHGYVRLQLRRPRRQGTALLPGRGWGHALRWRALHGRWHLRRDRRQTQFSTTWGLA